MKYLVPLLLTLALICLVHGSSEEVDKPAAQLPDGMDATPRRAVPCGPDCLAFVRNTRCNSDGCMKRDVRQDDMGPFWANRGKKDPTFMNDLLYVDEPRWVLVRRQDEESTFDYDPFFTTRGKKKPRSENIRVPRKMVEDTPFHAARGKKNDDFTPFQ